jgi:hypothetical protein
MGGRSIAPLASTCNAKYNGYRATRTNLVPGRTPVSQPTDEFITCHSCDFRYPRSRGICVMCGEAARASSPTQTSAGVGSDAKSSNRAPDGSIFGPPSQPPESQGRGKSIGLGIAVAVVLLVPLFLMLHNSQSSQSTEPVAAATKPQSQVRPEPVPIPTSATKVSARKVHTQAPADQQSANQLSETDPEVASFNPNQNPAELWKDVKGGSARAEVTLARLYLDGNVVPQSCEQTHMLLLAASKKGSKAADNLLTGAYVNRCQRASTQQN